ncbi:GH116 family glycosyl hydrolase [Sphingobacterium sp. CZ-UAM]|uniref:GH116 family glycosyl hydrolase n=1 Tax=Sphingobacterium sp. CZ-UAM TaxID=1933868 RepID=UPI001C379120|nr:GH116 family glycosyl hydrolase [Sphingobacterium sp. CZ-UAM]
MDRRSFFKKNGLLGLAVIASRFPVWSNSMFAWDNPIHNIPEEKNIDKQWIASLYERGDKIVYSKSKNELRYIGMPIGGLHAGTVYIGGDGRLWLWQIFNTAYDGEQEGIEPKNVRWNNGMELVHVRPRDGSAYVEPAIADNLRSMEQGFAVSVFLNGKHVVKELRENHWDEVLFEPTYPTCRITYVSTDFPVDVVLTAYSPFIPLDQDNSSLPLTTLHIELRNKVETAIEVVLTGWMENGVHKGRKDFKAVKKVSQVVERSGFKTLSYSCDQVPDIAKQAGDYGTMAFTCIDPKAEAVTRLKDWPIVPQNVQPDTNDSVVDFSEFQVGAFTVRRTLKVKENSHSSFAISWHFNNPHPKLQQHIKDAKDGYWYGTKFKDATSVIAYYLTNKEKLDAETWAWQQTWNNTTLPHWFMDRTFVNIGTLATANTMRFASGRFWGWEGVGSCAGTCTHVWQYGQSMGRLFPDIERNLREVTDLGVGFQPETGAIIFRAEYEKRPAIDGQAGVILRFYRDHQTSKDSTFLQRNWPKLKQAVQFILNQDKNADGMTDTPMENTLDAVWEGEIAWIVGLCLAAVQSAAYMANEVGDKKFEQTCLDYVKKGAENMDKELFNGEYYIHRPDAVLGRKKLGSYNTCHIDQVYGQAWCFQVDMPRINNKEKTISALKALWKYNFTIDVGPYIKTHVGGRPYALAGEGGMVLNTNPKNEDKAYGDNTTWQLGYFHECMSGFEHQVAAHMMAEGMTDESLILTRVIHDRYHAAKRNPFNEIECSDHYARAMASYGTFINACGFIYHGPKGRIGFAPKIGAADFKAPFTTAMGWGTYSQQKQAGKCECQLTLHYGQLVLNEFHLGNSTDLATDKKKVRVLQNEKPIAVAELKRTNERLVVVFKDKLTINKGDKLKIQWL